MARRKSGSTANHDGDIEAVDPPVVDDEGVPSRVLSLTIRADWGHFRRVDRTVTKQTYRIPPPDDNRRTSCRDLRRSSRRLLRCLHIRRFRYRDRAARRASDTNVPSLGLGTNPNETMETAGGTGQKSVKVRYPDSTDNRQIHSYEVLVNPAYRIDIAVEDKEFYTALKTHLEAGTSYYPPSMGLSEYLASVEYHGEFEPIPIESDDSVSVESVVPELVDGVVPSADTTHRVERMPSFMEAHDGGRRTTEFTDYAFADSGSITINTSEAVPVTIDNRTVLFH